MFLKLKNFFQLLKSKRSFFKENIWVIFTEYLWLFGVFIISLLYNRYYGTAALGIFSYGIAVSQIGILGLGSAFGNLIMRDVGTNSRLNEVYLKKVLQIRGSIILITLLIVLGIQYTIYPLTDKSHFIFILILIAAKGLDALCDTFYMVYLSLKLHKQYAFVKIFHALSVILFVTLSCVLKYSITVTYLAILCSSLIFFIFNFLFFSRNKNEMNKIENSHVSDNFTLKTPSTITFRYLAKESWSLLLSVIFFQVGSRISTVIIFGLIGSVSLGVYSSGFMLITCFTAAAPFMGIVLFPIFNRSFLENPSKLSKFILKIIPLIFLLGVLATIVCYFSIPVAISLMKNLPDYAAGIFAIMIWVIPFNYVIGIINSIFIIIKKQSIGMVVTFVILLVNMALVYFGALFYQIKGVAIASIIGSFFQVLIFLLVYLFVNRRHIVGKS